ncbi:MAG: aminopeptidase P family protein [Treponema sp.]|nr:aminopeptidase P family protein [Treponema sp.]
MVVNHAGILTDWLKENNVASAVFINDENNRSQHGAYLYGLPQDSILVATAKGQFAVCVWDENYAKKIGLSVAVPYTMFDRDKIKAVAGMLKMLKVSAKSKVELPPITSYPDFLKFVDALSQYNVLCREKGAHEFVSQCRQIKDSFEISAHKMAAKITNIIIDKIENDLVKGKIKTEIDVALLIEKELRKNDAESTSFDTLVAGPERSCEIHAFPPYTKNEFPAEGLSIIDFGVKYYGYCSDVTLTIAKGKLTAAQEKQLNLVQKAYDVGLKYYTQGVSVRTAAMKVDEVFAKAKRKMPHSLGHGIGLDIHEMPFVRANAPLEDIFEPGMIVTLEPGLYDEKIGGCRLENDVLITEKGNEVLTNSRIIRLP